MSLTGTGRYGEVRTTDPQTGGQKGAKLARFSLIPPEFTWALAEHYGRGSQKYEDRNWERGYKWSLSLDALERHLNQWKGGEDYDLETGSHHLIAVAWHACALFIFSLRQLGANDVQPEVKWNPLHADIKKPPPIEAGGLVQMSAEEVKKYNERILQSLRSV